MALTPTAPIGSSRREFASEDVDNPAHATDKQFFMLRSKSVGSVLFTLALVALLPAAGCSGALHEPGTSCSADGDCAAGLSCLGIGSASGGSCTTVARSCTKTCATDLDCLAVGSGYRCLPNCQNGGTCALTRLVGD